jgi:hypothetical protein
MTPEQINQAALLLCHKRGQDPTAHAGCFYNDAKNEIKAFVEVAQSCEQVLNGEVTI